MVWYLDTLFEHVVKENIQLIYKHRPIRLKAAAYRKLCIKVVERDSHCQGNRLGYRCKTPWYMLSPHHIIFRSHGGEDTEENLTLLCIHCHNAAHGIRSK